MHRWRLGLPAVRPNNDDRRDRGAARSARRPAPRRGFERMQKPGLLVIEDEPAIARLISLSLGREGFDVHVATNGEDALDLAAEIHPDAVVLDLGLPGADGLTVLDELRDWSDLPVVVVTGRQT